VFWFDFPMSREEMIPAINEVFWDPVLKWMFSGNLIPSAAGKHGSILDLMEAAPHRPGRFWALETRYRPGVTDHAARSALTALEVVAGRPLPEGRTASGSLLLLEGPQLDEEALAAIAREVLCNEMMETWTLYSEAELIKSDRFHQERIRRDLPKMVLRGADRMDTFSLGQLPAGELASLAQKRNWNLSEAEMVAIQQHFSSSALRELRPDAVPS
jgi:phosphoribosylformylglycinamidine (FGAM) synthase PurS component